MFFVILKEWHDVEYHHDCHEFVAVRGSYELATALRDELQRNEFDYHYVIEEHTDLTVKISNS